MEDDEITCCSVWGKAEITTNRKLGNKRHFKIGIFIKKLAICVNCFLEITARINEDESVKRTSRHQLCLSCMSHFCPFAFLQWALESRYIQCNSFCKNSDIQSTDNHTMLYSSGYHFTCEYWIRLKTIRLFSCNWWNYTLIFLFFSFFKQILIRYTHLKQRNKWHLFAFLLHFNKTFYLSHWSYRIKIVGKNILLHEVDYFWHW